MKVYRINQQAQRIYVQPIRTCFELSDAAICVEGLNI